MSVPGSDPAAVDPDPLTSALLSMAMEAGAAILAIYAGPTNVIEKGDGSPVTAADHAAEAIILRRLAEAYPDLLVVAEEAVASGQVPVHAQDFILVDPLDGTREFIGRNGEFTVNIAIIRSGVPTQGVVYAPALGEIYWSTDKGAFRARVEDGAIGAVEAIRVRPAPEGSLSVLASRSHLCNETQSMIAALDAPDIVSVGSSLKLCWLASGKADVYPRLSPTMQWDIAAGHAVLKAAGGSVRNITLPDWPELSYAIAKGEDAIASLRNPHFVALGDTGLAEKVRDSLSRCRLS